MVVRPSMTATNAYYRLVDSIGNRCRSADPANVLKYTSGSYGGGVIGTAFLDGGSEQRIFTKFPVRSGDMLAEIGIDCDDPTEVVARIYLYDSATWDENTLCWNNMPALPTRYLSVRMKTSSTELSWGRAHVRIPYCAGMAMVCLTSGMEMAFPEFLSKRSV